MFCANFESFWSDLEEKVMLKKIFRKNFLALSELQLSQLPLPLLEEPSLLVESFSVLTLTFAGSSLVATSLDFSLVSSLVSSRNTSLHSPSSQPKPLRRNPSLVKLESLSKVLESV